MTIDRGPVDLGNVAGDLRGCFGVLVVEGLIVAELQSGHANTAWLIGADDVIRPWEMDQLSLTRGIQWSALRPTRLVRLDRSFYARSRDDPQALNGILCGAARTGRWLLAKSLVISSPLIEERLLLLFALYGERWGRRTPQGVTLQLPLTHRLLAALCGARRPSVSHALRKLERKGLLSCPARGEWVLHSPLGCEPACGAPEYATALGFPTEHPGG